MDTGQHFPVEMTGIDWDDQKGTNLRFKDCARVLFVNSWRSGKLVKPGTVCV